MSAGHPAKTDHPAAYVFRHPLAFVLQTLKAFRANQGLLLAGAVAYYPLLSIVPLTGLIVIVLSHWIGQGELITALARYLEWLVPGQSKAMVFELKTFLKNREVVHDILV